MIYFTSDLHLGHQNIIYHTNRPFNNSEEMDYVLLKNLNEVVQPKDTLYILGDFTFYGGKEVVQNYRNRIYCKNIHFIKGNHDKDHACNKIFKTHQDYLELKHNKQYYILCHYPFRSWNHLFRGAIDLHGHQHNKQSYNTQNKQKGILRYDVGVDANNFYPVPITRLEKFKQDTIKNQPNGCFEEE